jgi:hypothetical protein
VGRLCSGQGVSSMGIRGGWTLDRVCPVWVSGVGGHWTRCVQYGYQGWMDTGQAVFRRGLRCGLRGCVQNRSDGWVDLNRLCSEEVSGGGLTSCLSSEEVSRVG